MRPISLTAVDGRDWTVTSHTDYQQPALGDTFEHDVSSNSGALWIMLPLAAFWSIAIYLWVITHPIVPWFFWLAAVVITGFFPLRWWLRRPRSIVAETLGNVDLSAERWVGNVRGVSKRREEVRIVVRRLRTQGTPGHADSPLQPVS
jgi:hypothetical protein